MLPFTFLCHSAQELSVELTTVPVLSQVAAAEELVADLLA